MKVTQVELSYPPGDKMVCWLPSETYKLKKGMLVSLQGSPRIWEITEIYNTQEHYQINKVWRVGGLDI